MHWTTPYLDRPWVAGGRGPESFDCWGLLRWVQHHEFRRELLPDYPIPPSAKQGVARAMEDAICGEEWRKLSGPVHSCAVGMSAGKRLHHVGVFIAEDGGLVLHAKADQRIALDSLATLRRDEWRRIEFYWHTSWQKTQTS